MTNAPLIFDVKHSSFDDGPGIRSVVFLKGCPLSCTWCHNPESQKPQTELLFDSNKCITCGECEKACSQGAISLTNVDRIDRDKCNLHFDCVDSCPTGALEKVGIYSEIDSLSEKILSNKPFFESSNGGVTVSGGEPLMHMDFVSSFLRKMKSHNIHTLIQTSGMFNYSTFEKKVLPYTDTFYMDIKILDSINHKRYCGVSNEPILQNFKHFQAAANKGEITFLPRLPLIPGITDTLENLTDIADFLVANNWNTLQVLPYNPLWIDKSKKIGIKAHQEPSQQMASFISEASIKDSESIFTSRGIKVY